MFYYFLFLLIHFPHFLVGYSFGTIDLGIVVTKMHECVTSNGGVRFIIHKYYFGESGRSSLPDDILNLYLDTTISDRWIQSISIEYREIRKRKECDRVAYPFCVRVVFDKTVGGYVIIVCRLSHLGHVVNLSSIIGHVKFEADLSIEERSQLANFGKIDYTGLQSKTALCRLFSNRT